MLTLNKCFCSRHRLRSFPLVVYHTAKLKFLTPLRTVTYKYGVKIPKHSPLAKVKPLSGIYDPNFTENIKVLLRHPSLFKLGFINLLKETRSFFSQEKDRISLVFNPPVGDQHDKIHILYKFENQEDLEGYSVNTDSAFGTGFSSAALRITQEETAEFSGHICEDVPKNGNVDVAGFANIMCPTQDLSFFRKRHYNWQDYSHLVFKIRGDGRSYLVILHTPFGIREDKQFLFGQIMYTRGGPYWQIVKMPFSHFFVMVDRNIPDGDVPKVPLTRILRMSIMATGFEGPFKLEIDYIGLTYDKWHKTISPYEKYDVR